MQHKKRFLAYAAGCDFLKQALAETIAKILVVGLNAKLDILLIRNLSIKYDYNQILTEKGIRAVTHSLSQAVSIKNVSNLDDNRAPLYQSFTKLYDQQFAKVIGAKTINEERAPTITLVFLTSISFISKILKSVCNLSNLISA